MKKQTPLSRFIQDLRITIAIILRLIFTLATYFFLLALVVFGYCIGFGILATIGALLQSPIMNVALALLAIGGFYLSLYLATPYIGYKMRNWDSIQAGTTRLIKNLQKQGYFKSLTDLLGIFHLLSVSVVLSVLNNFSHRLILIKNNSEAISELVKSFVVFSTIGTWILYLCGFFQNFSSLRVYSLEKLIEMDRAKIFLVLNSAYFAIFATLCTIVLLFIISLVRKKTAFSWPTFIYCALSIFFRALNIYTIGTLFSILGVQLILSKPILMLMFHYNHNSTWPIFFQTLAATIFICLSGQIIFNYLLVPVAQLLDFEDKKAYKFATMLFVFTIFTYQFLAPSKIPNPINENAVSSFWQNN